MSRTSLAKGLPRSAIAIGCSMAVGDTVCQYIATSQARTPELSPDLARHMSAAEQTQPSDGRWWDRRRTATMSFIGMCVTGPVSHMWNISLERLLPGTSAIRIAQKTVANGMFAFVFSLPLLFTAVTLLSPPDPNGNRKTLLDVERKVRNDLVAVWVAGTFYWPAVNIFTFRVVPAHHRAVVSSLFGTLWGVYLSAKANATVPVEGAPAATAETTVQSPSPDPKNKPPPPIMGALSTTQTIAAQLMG
eukprot:TRINITY_DN7932_c0_g1_i1.p1 TRINITY_DN7932_c0_g1~~TRINITY_DN7932_c0_g1_i1.p1  ORF type:complete len:247 (+),score=16.38 TRINITY_DN7932_c0_g1_i1:177-917(+)